jgi:hypothetical protein
MPYFTCTFFTKFTYNEYIGPFFIARCSTILASELPEWTMRDVVLILWWFGLCFRQYDIGGGRFLNLEVGDGQAAHVDDGLICPWKAFCGQNILLIQSPSFKNIIIVIL